jgi:hypothetical protein
MDILMRIGTVRLKFRYRFIENNGRLLTSVKRLTGTSPGPPVADLTTEFLKDILQVVKVSGAEDSVGVTSRNEEELTLRWS